jgi:hypothetical protein
VPGISKISTPDTATITNLHPGMRTAGIVENLTTGDGTDSYWAQRVTEYGVNPRTWWRVSSDLVGSFNPWAIEGTQATKVTEWHVFLAAGQSNMSGRAIVAVSEGGRYMQPRIAQFGYTRRVLETATVPLDMHDTATGLSPASVFAQAYIKTQPNHVGVLIVPAAHGGTGFTTSTTTQTWTPGITTNPLYDLPGAAVTQVNAALSAVAATGAASVLKGILWHQGEDNSTMSQATYTANLDALIAYFRAQLGNPNLPFVVGQMAPENIIAITGRANIDAAHRETPSRVRFTGFAPARTNGYNPGDQTHMSQDGVDFLGRNYVDAFEQAQDNGVIDADTGERDISALSSGVTGVIKLRRMGNLVEVHMDGVAPTATVGTLDFVTLPVGFRPIGSGGRRYWLNTNAAGIARSGYVYGSGVMRVFSADTADQYRHTYTFGTGDAWPATLPGTALP